MFQITHGYTIAAVFCLGLGACSKFPPGSAPLEKIKTSQANEEPGGLINLVASPDGTKLLTMTKDGFFIVWNTRTLKEIFRSGGEPIHPLGAAWTNENQWVALTTDGLVSWDVRKGKEISRIPTHCPKEIGALNTFGTQALVMEPETQGVLIQTKTGKRKSLCPKSGEEPVAAAFSPLGNRVALATRKEGSDKVLILDTQTLQVKTEVEPNQGLLTQLHYSLGGTIIATVGQDNEVRLWDSQNGQSRGSVQTAYPVVGTMAFSADTQKLAISSSLTKEDSHPQKTGSWNFLIGQSNQNGSMIQVFDVQSRQELARTMVPELLFRALLFTQQGSALFSAGDDGHLSLWKIPEMG